MKKALVIGVNFYEHLLGLDSAVNDAYEVKQVLERNADGTKNFDVRLLTSSGTEELLERDTLRSQIEELYNGNGDVAILYFAGHGYLDSTGGYLLSSDSSSGHDGIALSDIIQFSNASKIQNRIIILDCCHSGIAASTLGRSGFAELKEGTTILTASTEQQAAQENQKGGVFTSLFVDALNGAAANLLGDITPGSIYAHIDQSLGSWQQRPVFKTNVEHFVSLRKTHSPVAIADLQKLADFFPSENHVFQLDPSYEPERSEGQESLPLPNDLNTANFAILQKLNRVNLVVPEGAPHMWHAAIESAGCRLTVLGEHYRRLVNSGHI